MKQIEQYCRVKLTTDSYQGEGVGDGSIGYVIEVYGKDKKKYEIEFSDPSTGATIAQIVVSEREIEVAE